MTSNDSTNLPIPIDQLPNSLLAPHELHQALKQALTTYVTEERAKRGTTHVPEETYELIRNLTTSSERLADYGHVFASISKEAKKEIETDLIAAVGEYDGVPVSGVTVPDKAGDIRLSLDQANSYDFDVNQLRAVVVSYLSGEKDPAVAADLAIKLFCELGNFTPQIAKVKSVASQLSRENHDTLASVLTSTVTKKSVYRGVKVVRKHDAKKS